MDAHVHIPKTNGNTPNIPNIEDDASKQRSTAVPSYERWISSVKTQKSNRNTKRKHIFNVFVFVFFIYIS